MISRWWLVGRGGAALPVFRSKLQPARNSEHVWRGHECLDFRCHLICAVINGVEVGMACTQLDCGQKLRSNIWNAVTEQSRLCSASITPWPSIIQLHVGRPIKSGDKSPAALNRRAYHRRRRMSLLPRPLAPLCSSAATSLSSSRKPGWHPEVAHLWRNSRLGSSSPPKRHCMQNQCHENIRI